MEVATRADTSEVGRSTRNNVRKAPSGLFSTNGDEATQRRAASSKMGSGSIENAARDTSPSENPSPAGTTHGSIMRAGPAPGGKTMQRIGNWTVGLVAAPVLLTAAALSLPAKDRKPPLPTYVLKAESVLV